MRPFGYPFDGVYPERSRTGSGLRLIQGKLLFAQGRFYAGINHTNFIYTKLATFPSSKISGLCIGMCSSI